MWGIFFLPPISYFINLFVTPALVFVQNFVRFSMSCSSGGRNAGLQFLLVVWYHETSGGETRPLKSTPMLASGTIKMHALVNQKSSM